MLMFNSNIVVRQYSLIFILYLQNDHKSTSKQLSLVNSTLTTYNDKIAKLNSENAQLQEQIQLMTKTISMLNTGPTTTSEASLDAEKGGGVDAKIAALQTELDSVKSEWVATQQQLTDVTGSRMEADRLNAELSAQLVSVLLEKPGLIACQFVGVEILTPLHCSFVYGCRKLCKARWILFRKPTPS